MNLTSRLGLGLCYLAVAAPIAIGILDGPTWAILAAPAVGITLGLKLMRHRRRQATTAPLLTDSQMADLYEQIYDEDVSPERLLTMYAALPPSERHRSEWVMDDETRNRIRKLQPVGHLYTWTPDPALPVVEALIGLPVVVEPLAKLALRPRAVDRDRP